jgi:hypothetical protein
MILDRLLCCIGIHKEEVYLVAKPKYIHTGKDNKYYRSLRYNVYRIAKCTRCGKEFGNYKLKSNLKEQQAKMFIKNYVEIID